MEGLGRIRIGRDINPKKVIFTGRTLTKGDVADAVEQGAVSFRQVKKATRAGDACGHCKKKIKKLIRKLTEDHNQAAEKRR